MKKVAFWLSFLFLFILFFSNCGNNDNIINIAVIGPMKMAEGVGIKTGVQLAAQEINKKGGIEVSGIKYKVKLHFIDDRFSDVTYASIQLRKAIEEKGCTFVIGGFSSKVVLPLLDIVSQKKVLWFGTGGASPKIVGKVKKDYNNYKYYLRVGTMDATLQGRTIAEFATNILLPKGYKKAAIIGVNHSYTKYLCNDAKKYMEAAGFEIVSLDYVSSKIKDFTPYFNKAKKNADLIVGVFLTGETDVFIKQVHSSGLYKQMPIIGQIQKLQYSRYDYGNKFATNISTLQAQSGPVDMTGTGQSIKFARKYKKRFPNINQHWQSYPAYDALKIYKTAVEKSDSFRIDDILKVIEHPDFEYLGNIRYKWHKDNHDLFVGEINNVMYANFVWFQFFPDGKKYCVYPEKFKQKNYIYPRKNK